MKLEVTDGMCDYSRVRYNRMSGDKQSEYLARLRRKSVYWIDDRRVTRREYEAARRKAAAGAARG